MYTVVLFAHSWTRWILVLLAVVLVFRSLVGLMKGQAYTGMDKSLGLAFFWALNIQFVLGIALYAGLSPVTRAAFSDMAAAMKDGAIRFFVAEHFVTAFLAIGAGHFGIARAKRMEEDRKKHLFMLIGSGLCLLLMLALIPWPNLPYGRALFFLP